jgi:hypothetical protein
VITVVGLAKTPHQRLFAFELRRWGHAARAGILTIQPRTVLLREGLDRTPAETYFVFEEEVLRAGTRVTQAFERTRWTDGRVHTWLRVRRQTGRGEGSSGLAFDRLINVPIKS